MEKIRITVAQIEKLHKNKTVNIRRKSNIFTIKLFERNNKYFYTVYKNNVKINGILISPTNHKILSIEKENYPRNTQFVKFNVEY